LLITVATTVSLVSRPRSRSASAQHREDLVAVHQFAACVHGEAAVGVTVQRDAEVGAVPDHLTAQAVHVGRTAVQV
jgi:hypothetical protein